MNISRTNTAGSFLEQVAQMHQRRQERLASGKRIARAADDSAGLAIAKRLEANSRGLAQGERNVADGQSMARTAEGSLQSSQDSLIRMRELTIQAQNGTLNAGDRDIIQQEFDQLAAQITQTAGGTNFGGRALLDGSASGADAITITDGNGGETAIEIGDASAAALGVQGLSVGDPNTLAALDGAQNTLSSERARLGAVDNTFSRQISQLSAARISAEAARSRIEDVDVAKAAAESARDRILMEMSVAGQRISDEGRGRVLDLLG
tara:strand:- start:3162 stop:3956 length:795 start_codon:yes stop_codon:yes gene_type:complete